MGQKNDIGFFQKKIVVLLALMITLIMCVWVGCAYAVYRISNLFKGR
jgi:hypothetical protein